MSRISRRWLRTPAILAIAVSCGLAESADRPALQSSTRQPAPQAKPRQPAPRPTAQPAVVPRSPVVKQSPAGANNRRSTAVPQNPGRPSGGIPPATNNVPASRTGPDERTTPSIIRSPMTANGTGSQTQRPPRSAVPPNARFRDSSQNPRPAESNQGATVTAGRGSNGETPSAGIEDTDVDRKVANGGTPLINNSQVGPAVRSIPLRRAAKASSPDPGAAMREAPSTRRSLDPTSGLAAQNGAAQGSAQSRRAIKGQEQNESTSDEDDSDSDDKEREDGLRKEGQAGGASDEEIEAAIAKDRAARKDPFRPLREREAHKDVIANGLPASARKLPPDTIKRARDAIQIVGGDDTDPKIYDEIRKEGLNPALIKKQIEDGVVPAEAVKPGDTLQDVLNKAGSIEVAGGNASLPGSYDIFDKYKKTPKGNRDPEKLIKDLGEIDNPGPSRHGGLPATPGNGAGAVRGGSGAGAGNGNGSGSGGQGLGGAGNNNPGALTGPGPSGTTSPTHGPNGNGASGGPADSTDDGRSGPGERPADPADVVDQGDNDPPADPGESPVDHDAPSGPAAGGNVGNDDPDADANKTSGPSVTVVGLGDAGYLVTVHYSDGSWTQQNFDSDGHPINSATTYGPDSKDPGADDDDDDSAQSGSSRRDPETGAVKRSAPRGAAAIGSLIGAVSNNAGSSARDPRRSNPNPADDGAAAGGGKPVTNEGLKNYTGKQPAKTSGNANTQPKFGNSNGPGVVNPGGEGVDSPMGGVGPRTPDATQGAPRVP